MKERFFGEAKKIIRKHPVFVAAAVVLVAGTTVTEGNAFIHNSPEYPHLVNFVTIPGKEVEGKGTWGIGIRESGPRNPISEAGIISVYAGLCLAALGIANEIDKKNNKAK
jgi:hypothetical protein